LFTFRKQAASKVLELPLILGLTATPVATANSNSKNSIKQVDIQGGMLRMGCSLDC